jgi:uncharacterized protein involved in exopolysaccharide biosynthesis
MPIPQFWGAGQRETIGQSVMCRVPMGACYTRLYMEYSSKQSQASVVDFLEIWRAVWLGKWVIVSIAAIFSVGGVAYALLAQEWFRAETTLSPVDARKSLSGSLAQLGGLASIAGINLPGGSEQEPLAVLKSNDFAKSFIQDLNLVEVLTEGRSLDGSPPDVRDALVVFNQHVRSVSDDKRTKIVTLSVQWKDPKIAADWANQLVDRLNDRMRTQALEEAQRNVSYLQREMASTSVVSLQQSMGRVLEGEMQKLMLARGNKEFAFKVIDRASPPKLRESPKRTLVVLIALFMGGVVGAVVVLIRYLMRRETVA